MALLRWNGIRGALRRAVSLGGVLAVLCHGGSAAAVDTIAVGTISADPGAVGVSVPLTATTTTALTGLSVDITFPVALCAAITGEALIKAGRAAVAPLEGGTRCPDEGRVSIVLFDITGGTVVPTGSGTIAEWAFSIKADALAQSVPLTLTVVQARNGPTSLELTPSNGSLTIADGAPSPTNTAGPTSTPTVPPPTTTATKTSTKTMPPTLTPTVQLPTSTITVPPPTNTPPPPPPTDTPPTGTPPPSACVGDCNGDGMVAINELITGVNIALGSTTVSTCPSLDLNNSGEVEINELISAVNNALNGCPA